MREMKRVYEARAENIAKGHGQVRELAIYLAVVAIWRHHACLRQRQPLVAALAAAVAAAAVAAVAAATAAAAAL